MDELMESQILKKLIVMSIDILKSTDDYSEIQTTKLERIEGCKSEVLKARMMKEFDKDILEYKKQAELLLFEYQKAVCESKQLSKEFLLKMRNIQKSAVGQIEIKLSKFQRVFENRNEES